MKPGAKNIQTWPGKLKVYLSCFILYNHPFVCMISKIIDAMARGVLMPNAYAISLPNEDTTLQTQPACWREVAGGKFFFSQFQWIVWKSSAFLPGSSGS